MFTSTDQLARGAISCFDRAELTNSVVVVDSSRDETPIETCRRTLGIQGPLVACAGEGVDVFPGGPGTCERLGSKPLPAGYTDARARVLVLERELAAIERTADCVPLKAFEGRAQRVLDRLGWTGWRVQVRDDFGEGPCGSALTDYSNPGPRSIDGALIPDERTLLVTRVPRRSTLALLEGRGTRLMLATGRRCYSVAGVKRLVRDRLRAGGRPLSFTTGSPPAGMQRSDARGRRLAEGCAVIDSMAPTPDDRGIVVNIWR